MNEERLKLALIPYLNCEPFYAGIHELGHEVVCQPPRLVGERAARGELLCGPMAVVDLFRLREVVEPLGDFGIACSGPAHSVLLLSRCEIGSLSGRGVALTAESSTSVRLLQVLLARRFGIRCRFFDSGMGGDETARLVIGDEALRAAGVDLDGFPFVYDLGQEWFGWQAVPFVFARWVISRRASAGERERITSSLAEALATWPRRLSEIVARRGPDLDLDEEEIHEYLSSFTYRLGPAEEYGERVFQDLLTELESVGELRSSPSS